ncbi:MAG: hypothetical protein C4518_14760 [Desulfobacteraceae bacterium]|nr:MAG: hypothetical protein C4518_14760 [Desulfobacteraceae bacterium]
MPESQDKITIHATIEIGVVTLQTIVQNAKKLAGADEKGRYRVDTAETVNHLVSSFLSAHGFDEYVDNLENYK